MTLESRDVLATDKPSGVAAAMQLPRYLKVGGAMRVEIDGISHIENQVTEKPR